ncbi:MAG: SDR family oxidoreductase [Caldilineaceae bacterium]
MMANQSGSNQEVHVIFGTGPVGLAVMDDLLNRGKQIRLVNRSGRAAAPAGVQVVAGDAADSAFTRQVCADASVVYQCLNPPYTEWVERFPPLQAGVMAGVSAAGAKLVSMENVYMYGSTGGKPLVESLPYAAETRKGKVRAAMAEALLNAHQQGKVRAVIARAADFFGPRVKTSAMGERVFPAALAGKSVQVLGNPDLPHTYSYMPDIGRALVTLGQEEKALGQVWHIPSATTVTTRQFMQMVGEAIGKPVRVQTAPKFLLRLLGLFNGDLREVLEMIYQFEEPFVVDGSKFSKTFGFQPTTLPTAIKSTVAWWQQNDKSVK